MPVPMTRQEDQAVPQTLAREEASKSIFHPASQETPVDDFPEYKSSVAVPTLDQTPAFNPFKTAERPSTTDLDGILPSFGLPQPPSTTTSH